jgi:trehalose 6-phosphate phosphatase
VSELPEALVAALDAAAATEHLLVASDFDGTLAPIVSNPADARALPHAAAALIALADAARTSVLLVSGRALAILRELSAMPSTVHLVGSHGAEVDTDAGGDQPNGSGNVPGFANPIDTELLGRITAELTAIATGRPGVAVEAKPASVALHVRNATADDGAAALDAARAAAQSWNAELTAGKAVLEFAVVSTDKGAAIDALRDRLGATAVVFFGDDVTDEKAFRRMRQADVGVKVGPGDTLATYRVDAPDDVASALAHLVERRTAR